MSIDPRTVLMLQMCRGEAMMRQEIEREQVRHVSLEEYQPGHPHYEQLLGQMAENRTHSFEQDLWFNF